MYVLSWRICLLLKFDLSLIPQKLQQQNPEGFKICTSRFIFVDST